MFPNYNYLTRRSVSDNLKCLVLYRDNYTCCYCFKQLTFQSAHIDHATPRSKGGWTTFDNLRSSCSNCNLSKGGKTEAEFRSELASRASAISYLVELLNSPFSR